MSVIYGIINIVNPLSKLKQDFIKQLKYLYSDFVLNAIGPEELQHQIQSCDYGMPNDTLVNFICMNERDVFDTVIIDSVMSSYDIVKPTYSQAKNIIAYRYAEEITARWLDAVEIVTPIYSRYISLDSNQEQEGKDWLLDLALSVEGWDYIHADMTLEAAKAITISEILDICKEILSSVIF